MLKKLISFIKEEDGIETIEYALIAALIAIAVIAGATFLGSEVNDIYSGVGSVLNSAELPGS